MNEQHREAALARLRAIRERIDVATEVAGRCDHIRAEGRVGGTPTFLYRLDALLRDADAVAMEITRGAVARTL